MVTFTVLLYLEIGLHFLYSCR